LCVCCDIPLVDCFSPSLAPPLPPFLSFFFIPHPLSSSSFTYSFHLASQHQSKRSILAFLQLHSHLPSFPLFFTCPYPSTPNKANLFPATLHQKKGLRLDLECRKTKRSLRHQSTNSPKMAFLLRKRSIAFSDDENDVTHGMRHRCTRNNPLELISYACAFNTAPPPTNLAGILRFPLLLLLRSLLDVQNT
jgi:hypothetical protein